MSTAINQIPPKIERNTERSIEIREFVISSAKYLSVPLFALLWVMDFIYAPSKVWACLGIRSLSIPFCLLTLWAFRNPRSLIKSQIIASLYVLSNSIIVTLLIYITEGAGSPYYAGLNLVAFGIVYFPWTKFFLILNILLIFGPYTIGAILTNKTADQIRSGVISSFFMVGTVVICIVIRKYMEKLRHQEIDARKALREEIIHRDEIIELKTKNELKLKQLGMQFSPKVVERILSGAIQLQEPSTTHICVAFIDIVQSTNTLNNISISNFEKLISKFLIDVTNVLLKHDVTIDKFVGDGIICFTNAPIHQENYTDILLQACIEIIQMIQIQQNEIQPLWGNKFQLRCGIASGIAKIGLYGGESNFKTYTAIGEPMHLAARLCSSASPDSILINYEAMNQLKAEYPWKEIETASLKGFEKKIIRTFSLDIPYQIKAKAA